jgi:iron(II)-dependent oxidoreductase
MKVGKFARSPTAAGALALLSLAWCWWNSGSALFWAGAAGLCIAVWRAMRLFQKRRRRPAKTQPARRVQLESAKPSAASPRRETPRQNAKELGSVVDQMITDGRYALLLRPQICGDLTQPQFERSYQLLEEEMALVPTGEVGIELADFADFSHDHRNDEVPEAVVRVESFYMDRYLVTNEQFQAFVDAGAYAQSSIWDAEVLPAVLDFVDKTGQPGPRFWSNGRFPSGKGRHPVVGVSWYEACAYARWTGKRLPTDAEWVKAAAWPVALGTSTRRQRRYPWGQSMDRERANLWAASTGGTVAVDEYPEGVSVGGVYQLIGNVWEWTLGDFDPGFSEVPSDETDQAALKNIRGGAFDTYFENQATCQFASGEFPLARKHNIGFRCVLGSCDLAVDPTAPAVENEDELEVTA